MSRNPSYYRNSWSRLQELHQQPHQLARLLHRQAQAMLGPLVGRAPGLRSWPDLRGSCSQTRAPTPHPFTKGGSRTIHTGSLRPTPIPCCAMREHAQRLSRLDEASNDLAVEGCWDGCWTTIGSPDHTTHQSPRMKTCRLCFGSDSAANFLKCPLANRNYCLTICYQTLNGLAATRICPIQNKSMLVPSVTR